MSYQTPSAPISFLLSTGPATGPIQHGQAQKTFTYRPQELSNLTSWKFIRNFFRNIGLKFKNNPAVLNIFPFKKGYTLLGKIGRYTLRIFKTCEFCYKRYIIYITDFPRIRNIILIRVICNVWKRLCLLKRSLVCSLLRYHYWVSHGAKLASGTTNTPSSL